VSFPCVFGPVLILVCLPGFPPRILPTRGIGFPPRILPTRGIRAYGLRLGRVQFDPVSLEGEIIRYSSVSLSPTLSRNEKHLRGRLLGIQV